MKRTIIYIVLAVVAIIMSFYTENLTEKNRREQLAQLKPDQLVETMMRDSINQLAERAITLSELKEGMNDENFARQHGHVLGIGSPTFYILKGTCEQISFNNDELHGMADGVKLTIPLKYIFGNTVREASGWFNIDNFQNTTDFNAVSAAMNTYIIKQFKSYQVPDEGRIEFLGAVAVKGQAADVEQLTLIPYRLR